MSTELHEIEEESNPAVNVDEKIVKPFFKEEFPPEYVEILRKTTPEQKLKTISRLWWTARSIALAGRRNRHPEKSQEELARMVRDVMFYARD